MYLVCCVVPECLSSRVCVVHPNTFEISHTHTFHRDTHTTKGKDNASLRNPPSVVRTRTGSVYRKAHDHSIRVRRRRAVNGTRCASISMHVITPHEPSAAQASTARLPTANAATSFDNGRPRPRQPRPFRLVPTAKAPTASDIGTHDQGLPERAAPSAQNFVAMRPSTCT